jgi:hypothetical protein
MTSTLLNIVVLPTLYLRYGRPLLHPSLYQENH